MEEQRSFDQLGRVILLASPYLNPEVNTFTVTATSQFGCEASEM